MLFTCKTINYMNLIDRLGNVYKNYINILFNQIIYYYVLKCSCNYYNI